MTEQERKIWDKTQEYVQKFEQAMEDDFNTADAISAIFELVKYSNTNISSENSKEYLEALKERFIQLSDILGITLKKEKESLEQEVEALIEERQQARKAKNFQRADEIRNQLQQMGILLEDTREGVKWKRI